MNIYEVGIVFYSYLKKTFEQAFLNQYNDNSTVSIFLPEKNIFIAFDDDGTIEYKHSSIAENDLYTNKETSIYRFRTLRCVPLNSPSFDYYLDNLDGTTVLTALKFLLSELEINISVLSETFNPNSLLKNYDKHSKEDFDTYIDCCKKYILSEKLPFIDVDVVYGGMFIGKWINQQPDDFSFIMQINSKNLSIIKIKESWDRYYQLCKYYITINNDDKIPQTYEYKGYKLGRWISEQRSVYAEGKLNAERIRRFETIGIPWNIFFDNWNYAYDLLENYKKEHESINLTKRETYLDFRLGDWLVKQRQSYKKGTLSEYRINKLTNLGVVWNVNEQSWLNYYELLKEYKAENRTSYLPKRVIYKEQKLGQWVMLQINAYRENNLLKERYDLLDSIGFWDDAKHFIKIQMS